MNFFSTGVEAVDQMGQLQIVGNIKPAIWNKTIVNEKGKPQRLAMDILADIVYWYRPTEIRDENSGMVIGWKKRFASDMLQRGYAELCEQFGEERKTIFRAMDFLEDLGVIRRVYRKLRYSNGMVANNVMFIDLNVNRLTELSFPEKDAVCDTSEASAYKSDMGEYEVIEEENADKMGTLDPMDKKDHRVWTNMSIGYGQNCPEGMDKNDHRVLPNMSIGCGQNCPEGIDKNVQTYTEITTQTTTEILSSSLSNQIKKTDADVDIDVIFDYVSNMMGYEELHQDNCDDIKAQEFNVILDEIRKVLVYEVFAASDDKQFNFGTKDQPDYKSASMVKNVFYKHLGYPVILGYIRQFLDSSTKVKNAAMYHIKSLYRQCLTASSPHLSGKNSMTAKSN